MKKFNTQKRFLIPLITAACMMYGCSSQTAAPAQTEAVTEAADKETAANTQQENEGTKEADEKTFDQNSTETADSEENADTKKGAENEDTEDDAENTEDDTKDAESEESKSDDNDNESEESSEAEEDIHIQTVKNAQPESFPGCSYGNAFDEFFSSPKWDYFESTDGRDVVEFTGECMYAGARTKARMQFILNNANSTVATGALYYNNTPQSTKIITDSINKIFEQYAKAHGIPYTLPAPSVPESTQTNALPPDTQVNVSPSAAQTDSPATTIHSSGSQAALDFAAWTNPNIGSWYSPSTGYYVIPFVDNAGNASISFATDNTRASYAAVYYTDAVSAVTNEAGGLTYQGYIYTASSGQPQLIGMVEVAWNSIAELNTLSVKMINGNQTMDTSMSGSDYAYYGTVRQE